MSGLPFLHKEGNTQGFTTLEDLVGQVGANALWDTRVMYAGICSRLPGDSHTQIGTQTNDTIYMEPCSTSQTHFLYQIKHLDKS